MATTFELIQAASVGSGGASEITFMNTGNIPSTFTDLVVKVSARGETSSSSVDLRLRFNGNTTSTYTHRRLQGNGSTAVSSSETNGTSVYCGEISAATGTSSTFSNTEIYIPNYRSSVAKSFSVDAAQENNSTTAYASLFASIWNPSPQEAITSITLLLGTGNFAQYSTAYLYGVKNA